MTSGSAAAEHGIGRLVADFADAVNRRDADALVELFAPDGEWVIRTFGQHRGPEQIRAFITPVLARWDVIVQCIHSGTVDVVGPDRATGRWYLTEAGVRAGAPVSLAGRYDDAYVLTDGHWRFGSRTFDLMYEDRDGQRSSRPLPDDAIGRTVEASAQNPTGPPR